MRRDFSLTVFLARLFVETQLVAVVPAGRTVRLHHRPRSWSYFVEISLQDPLVLQTLVGRHSLGGVPTAHTNDLTVSACENLWRESRADAYLREAAFDEV